MTHEPPYWNPEMETLPRQHLRDLQESRLLAHLPHVYQHSALLRHVWDEAGVHPSHIRSLADFTANVPTIDKAMVRDYRDQTGDPFGGMHCGPETAPFDIHSSSGTTGPPTFLPSHARDIEVFAESFARHYWCAGLRPGMTLSLSMELYPRLILALRAAAHRIGARVALTDWTDIPRVLHTLRYIKPHVHIFLTPPQALGFRQEMAAQGVDPKALFEPLQGLIWAGDALTPKMRRLIENEWDSEVYEMSGTADLCYVMMECPSHDGLHAHDDMWFLEVVEPGTTIPVAPGERGEFLFTALMDGSLAFVRWRSEDMGYVTTEPCVCGRTSTRLYFSGRVQYRVSVRGQIIFPVDIQHVLEHFSEVDHGLFQIIRYAPEMEMLRLRIGFRSQDTDRLDTLQSSLESYLAEHLGLPVAVVFVPADDLLALGPPHKIPRIHDASGG